MSCLHTEKILEAKLESYQNMIEMLDDEFLGYEFSDRIGAECGLPNREQQVEALLDQYSVCLFESNDIDWVAEWCKEHIKDAGDVIPLASSKCQCCGSKEDLRASSFGGYADPTWAFTCQECTTRSQEEHDNQVMSGEIRDSLNDY